MNEIGHKIYSFFGSVRLLIILGSVILSLILMLNVQSIVPSVSLDEIKTEGDSLSVSIRISNWLPAKLRVKPFQVRLTDGEGLNVLLNYDKADTLRGMSSRTLVLVHRFNNDDISSKLAEISKKSRDDKLKLIENRQIEMEIFKTKGIWDIR